MCCVCVCACACAAVDLCVVGSRGYGPIRRALLGSVSSAVAQMSDCPVMIVKRPKESAGAYLTVLPRRVFLHADVSEHGRSALRWAMRHLLQEDIDEVVLVAVNRAAGKELQVHEYERIQTELVLDEFQGSLMRSGLTKVTKLTGNGPIGETLLRLTVKNSCDLFVAGLSAGKTLFGESTAMYIAHNAPFPVIVVGTDRRKGSICSQPIQVGRFGRSVGINIVGSGPPLSQQLVGSLGSGGSSFSGRRHSVPPSHPSSLEAGGEKAGHDRAAAEQHEQQAGEREKSAQRSPSINMSRSRSVHHINLAQFAGEELDDEAVAALGAGTDEGEWSKKDTLDRNKGSSSRCSPRSRVADGNNLAVPPPMKQRRKPPPSSLDTTTTVLANVSEGASPSSSRPAYGSLPSPGADQSSSGRRSRGSSRRALCTGPLTPGSPGAFKNGCVPQWADSVEAALAGLEGLGEQELEIMFSRSRRVYMDDAEEPGRPVDKPLGGDGAETGVGDNSEALLPITGGKCPGEMGRAASDDDARHQAMHIIETTAKIASVDGGNRKGTAMVRSRSLQNDLNWVFHGVADMSSSAESCSPETPDSDRTSPYMREREWTREEGAVIGLAFKTKSHSLPAMSLSVLCSSA